VPSLIQCTRHSLHLCMALWLRTYSSWAAVWQAWSSFLTWVFRATFCWNTCHPSCDWEKSLAVSSPTRTPTREQFSPILVNFKWRDNICSFFFFQHDIFLMEKMQNRGLFASQIMKWQKQSTLPTPPGKQWWWVCTEPCLKRHWYKVMQYRDAERWNTLEILADSLWGYGCSLIFCMEEMEEALGERKLGESEECRAKGPD
jgi:hypothetical protein